MNCLYKNILGFFKKIISLVISYAEKKVCKETERFQTSEEC